MKHHILINGKVQLSSFHTVVLNIIVVRVIKKTLATFFRKMYIMPYIEALNVEFFDALQHAQ